MYNRPKSRQTVPSKSYQLLPRIIGVYAAIVALAFFLGTGFFFILFGMASVAFWLADDWEVAYWMQIGLLRIRPATSGFYPRPRSLLRWILILVKLVVILYCIGLGITILSKGFLEQNIIYLLLRG